MTAIEENQSFEGEPTAETKLLLTLMAAGATDRAIARELGISERTVHRRIARLQVLLGAHSRFQLGFQVRARHWL
ncbi:helix-turn-helix domain-containing protein [Lentzea nigeriaca]|uniref:helix-turn-helix domain-containing protein n=1 Tax=Lentzea nigeriaca TaxID=1128665 RepID=UPI001EF8E3F3|nr:helix-turn-helix transcriptional regulator [Lentzea nigeriaca]MBM7856296.1 DNA-binding NarL/FixJ family response regulator [Lentzea nigeriaca]